MNEHVMELVDRFAAVLEENAQLRARLDVLESVVKAAEIEDALRKEHNKDEIWACFNYGATLPTEQINMIMGWRRAYKAEEIIERLKGERNSHEHTNNES